METWRLLAFFSNKFYADSLLVFHTCLFTPSSFDLVFHSSVLSHHASGSQPFFFLFSPSLRFNIARRGIKILIPEHKAAIRETGKATQSCWKHHRFNAHAYQESSHGPRLRAHEAWGKKLNSQHIKIMLHFCVVLSCQ